MFKTKDSFITQEAKLRLEKAGAIIYKDASANKGGVTSSSLEGTLFLQDGLANGQSLHHCLSTTPST